MLGEGLWGLQLHNCYKCESLGKWRVTQLCTYICTPPPLYLQTPPDNSVDVNDQSTIVIQWLVCYGPVCVIETHDKEEIFLTITWVQHNHCHLLSNLLLSFPSPVGRPKKTWWRVCVCVFVCVSVNSNGDITRSQNKNVDCKGLVKSLYGSF